MRNLSVALSLCVLLITACDSQKKPAEAAFAELQASVAPVSAELEKYAPEQYAQLNELIDSMKQKLNSQDYAGALALRAEVMAQLVAASSASGKRKNELVHQLAGQWRELSSSVPVLLAQLTNRVNTLKAAAKLPADVSASNFEQARQSLSDLNIEWTAALNAMKSRDTETAVTKAQAITKRAAEMGVMLGLKPAPAS
jgi:hypothetical protein